jgi:hypothetical protein
VTKCKNFYLIQIYAESFNLGEVLKFFFQVHYIKPFKKRFVLNTKNYGNLIKVNLTFARVRIRKYLKVNIKTDSKSSYRWMVKTLNNEGTSIKTCLVKTIGSGNFRYRNFNYFSSVHAWKFSNRTDLNLSKRYRGYQCLKL